MENIIKALFVTFGTFFAPLYLLFTCVGVLTFIDMIFAIIVANKFNETISSKKLGMTLTKIFIHFLLIIAAAIMQVMFPALETVKLVYMIGSAICLYEFYSLAETYEKLTGIKILKKIKSILDNALGRNQEQPK